MTLIEVMAALLVLSLGLLVLASMQAAAMKGHACSRRLSQATNLAKTAMEELLAAPASQIRPGRQTVTDDPGGFEIISTIQALDPQSEGVLLSVEVIWLQSNQTRSLEIRSIRRTRHDHEHLPSQDA